MTPPAADESAAIALAFETIARGSKSFALASRILPPEFRAEAAVLYAWCRRVDDAVDLAPTPMEARAALAQERALLEQVYVGSGVEDASLAAFAAVVKRRQIPQQVPFDLLAGMEMDVAGHQYQSLDELLLYCYRVAGTVGLMMSHVMGLSNASALPNACHLGIGMQLTNICRDVEEDWGRGRLYLPADLLGPAVTALARDQLGHPIPLEVREPLARGVGQLLALAQRYYRSGDLGLGALTWRCALSVRTARGVYSAIGAVLARRGFDVIGPRAVVSNLRKLLLVARSLLASAVEWPGRWVRPFARAQLPQEVTVDELVHL